VIQYVFRVTGARSLPVDVAVHLPEQRLPEWTGTRRELTASERYGIAKLSLKNALDRAPQPSALTNEVFPDEGEIAGIAETLDL
jgi:hypothetical protein